MKNGLWTDFFSDFMSYTETSLSTKLHRTWAGISLIAGAMERRVWVRAGRHISYPNLYVFLVAPPGTGKYIIEDCYDLWNSTIEPGTEQPAFHTAPHSVSRASLIDELNKSQRSFLPPSGAIYIYNSLLVAAEEFQVLLPNYDAPFIGTLNRIWNNPADHHETRRHGPAKDVLIRNPQLNIIAGATPAYFAAFPEEAWNTGLIRRVIMVFSATPQQKDFFQDEEMDQLSEAKQHLTTRLAQISNLFGEATWTIDAFQKVRLWHLEGSENSGGPPVPTHSKLQYYCKTRTQMLVKLALVSGISRLGIPKIELPDVDRAMEWLFEAEAVMPDIFRAMTGKSDTQLMEELHYFMQAMWIKNKQKPIPGAAVARFLSQRAPSEKVPSLIELAERIDVIARPAGTTDLYIPRPKHLHGLE